MGDADMGELSLLPNIGKTVEEQLNQVGINTVKQLIETGSKQAWMRIKDIDDSACINRLYGLEGAIQGIRWHNLSETVKGELKEFYNSYK
jgi:DNA transformation protein and related proteins